MQENCNPFGELKKTKPYRNIINQTLLSIKKTCKYNQAMVVLGKVFMEGYKHLQYTYNLL